MRVEIKSMSPAACVTLGWQGNGILLLFACKRRTIQGTQRDISPGYFSLLVL